MTKDAVEYAEKFDKWARAYGYIREEKTRKILEPLFDLTEKWSLQSRDLNPRDYAYEASKAINDCLCLFHGCGEKIEE